MLAGVVRVVIFAVPLLASLVAARAMAGALATPEGLGQHLLWWAGVLAASLGALIVVDHAARRLLPLAALLRLSLIFPDRAPSRMSVALRCNSTRGLQLREVEALKRGDVEPAEAARTILSLAASLNVHDRNTRGHSERVRAYADLIAAEMDLDAEDRDRLRWAALLHDLGKLSVSPSTLNSHHELAPDDWETLRRHPIEGARLAEPLRGWLGAWALAIEQHHEKYDGTGYPHGLAGQEISLGARIVAVADSYDAMTSVRSYSTGMSAAAARQELAAKAGTHFDPVVVRAFLSVALGRVRWTMGPFAFLSVVPFAPALGGLRRSVETAARTAAMGSVSVIAAASVFQPPSEAAPSPAAEHPRRPAATARAPSTSTSVPPAVVPDADPAPVPDGTAGPAPGAVAPTGPGVPPAPPAAGGPAVATEVPAATTVPPTAAVAPTTTTPAAVAGECRVDGRSPENARPCQPPRWGHTETGNPEPVTQP